MKKRVLLLGLIVFLSGCSHSVIRSDNKLNAASVFQEEEIQDIPDEAFEKSLDFLNKSVYSAVHSFKQTLYVDNDKIEKIIQAYKQDPESIKTPEIHEFGAACTKRSQELLDRYHKDYFVPAYDVYRKYNKTVSFEEWKYQVPLSETSLFYDFYVFTESNLEDCQKIYARSK